MQNLYVSIQKLHVFMQNLYVHIRNLHVFTKNLDVFMQKAATSKKGVRL